MVPVTRAWLSRGIRVALGTAGISLLAACSSVPPSNADFPSPSATVVGATPVPQAFRTAAAPHTKTDLAGTPNEVEANLAVRFKAPINDDPGRLLGLDQPALQFLLGKPSFVRRDDPAQMWRYRHASCVLDLFLYTAPRESGASFRVRHVEARSSGLSSASMRTCLRALLVDRRRHPAG